MERTGQISRTAGLVGHHRLMINPICEKILDYMQPSRPAFTIHIIASQTG